MSTTPRRLDDLWLVVILVSTAAAIGAALAAEGTPLTTIPLLWFLAVCPGLPYVRLLRLGERRPERARSAETEATRSGDPVQRWILAVGLSLALDAVVAEALLYSNSYTALRAVVVLGGVACLGAVIGRLRDRGRSEPADAPDEAPVELSEGSLPK
jgi:4-hydroxybenzoate polyprenyltransferase